MGVEPSVYQPPYFSQPQCVEDIDEIIKWAEETKERWSKKAEEGKKEKEKKETKMRSFSFLEMLGMVTIAGPFIVGIEFWFFTNVLASLVTGK
jgi:hypothetical protein